jgi:hypothetical protein
MAKTTGLWLAHFSGDDDHCYSLFWSREEALRHIIKCDRETIAADSLKALEAEDCDYAEVNPTEYWCLAYVDLP